MGHQSLTSPRLISFGTPLHFVERGGTNEVSDGVRMVIFFIAFLILSFNLASAQTAFDPQLIGVGVRALGMGRAAAAVSDGGDAGFNNPAALGEVDHFKFTSMSGKILEDANYISFGGIYPLGQQSAVGMGYVGSFVSGIEIRDTNGTLSRRADFGNSLIIASYGKKIAERTSLGLNLKYYSVSASEITAGNGNGWNLDFGLLQSGINCCSLGIIGQNLLSSGKIRYQSGKSENLPMTLKIGSKIYLLGGNFGAAFDAPVELNAAVDFDFYWDSARTSGIHSGLEFSPVQALCLRAGMDQNLPTAGISLYLSGLGFHYAYRPDSDFIGSACHFFSITFNERGWPPEQAPDTYLGEL